MLSKNDSSKNSNLIFSVSNKVFNSCSIALKILCFPMKQNSTSSFNFAKDLIAFFSDSFKERLVSGIIAMHLENTAQTYNQTKRNTSVDVLLSTFNPNIHYLKKQITSLQEQKLENEFLKINIKLYWRDDCSDNYEEINSIIAQTDLRIEYWDRGLNNIGFLKSFELLMSKTKSDLIFFCDQDDIWKEDKILKMVQCFLSNFENDKNPVAIFSDCDCIDENERVIQEKFNLFYGFQPPKKATQFFFRNFVPGCTMMINRTLLEMYLKSKNLIQLHDHTMLHIAAIFGKIYSIPESLTLYRIHNENTLGFLKRPFKSKIYDLFNTIRFFYRKDKFWQKIYPKHIQQIQYFYESDDFKNTRNYLVEYQLIRDFLIKNKSKSSKGALIANGMDNIQKWVYKIMS